MPYTKFMSILSVILTFVGISLVGIVGTGWIIKAINDGDPTNKESDNERAGHVHDH